MWYATIEANRPFYGVLVSREVLLCLDPMKVEYFTHKKQNASWYHPEFCAYCAEVNGIGYVD